MSRYKTLQQYVENDYQQYCNTTSAAMGAEKKPRKGRPYSPYAGRETRKSRRLANCNISTNNNEIESSNLIAQIIEDQLNAGRLQSEQATKIRQNNNKLHQHHHHHHHYQGKQELMDKNAYRNVPNTCESDSEGGNNDDDEAYMSCSKSQSQHYSTRPPDDGSIAQIEIIESDGDEDGDEQTESRRRSQTISDQIPSTSCNANQKSAVNDERSDSVIFTGSYTQHDLDLEEVSRIRTNCKCLIILIDSRYSFF